MMSISTALSAGRSSVVKPAGSSTVSTKLNSQEVFNLNGSDRTLAITALLYVHADNISQGQEQENDQIDLVIKSLKNLK